MNQGLKEQGEEQEKDKKNKNSCIVNRHYDQKMNDIMRTDTSGIFMQILSNVKWNGSEMARRLKKNERTISLSIPYLQP